MKTKKEQPASAGRMPRLVVHLPCPFCGFEEPAAPRCPNCGACGPDDFSAWGMVGLGDDVPTDESDAWNRRAPSTDEVMHAKNLIHFIDTLGWVIDTLRHNHTSRPGITAIIKEVDRRMKSQHNDKILP